jgi:capsular exopolysaccharide synthesis family protein
LASWLLIVVAAGLSLLVGTAQLLRQIPLYTATSQVILDPQLVKTLRSGAVSQDSEFDDVVAMMQSQMAVVRSTVFLHRVVQKENLVSDPEFGSGVAPDASFLSALHLAGAARNISGAELRSTEALKGAVSVSTSPGYLLNISVTSTDPMRAARLANAIADMYIVDKLDARFEAAQRASSWLGDRIVELRKQLRSAEDAVTQFRNAHGLFESSGNVALDQEQMSNLNGKLVAARADVAQKRARVEMLDVVAAKSEDLQSLPDIGNSPSLGALRQQLATLSQQEADLLTRYGPPHPLVVNNRAQRRDVERAIAAEVQRLADNVRNEYKLAQAQVASLEQAQQSATGKVNLDDPTALQLRELERTVEINKTMFDDFLQRAKITQQESSFEPRDARVITPALPPGAASSPNSSRYLGVSLILGIVLGLGVAFAKDMLNTGFKMPNEIEEVLGLPVLSIISHMRRKDLTVDGETISVEHFPSVRPLSRYSESIRALKSGLQMTDVDNPPKVVQVTSAMPGEGKTTIALSLAALGAQAGYRVLLIDADLRHPSATHHLGLYGKPGLVDLLLNRARQDDVIKSVEVGRYWVLPAGNKTQNPADLLGSERLKLLVASYKQSFDMVVIDAPPAGPVVDPLIVSQLCDTIVMVVRWASTPREVVLNSLQRFRGRKKIAGIVLNFFDERGAGKYGYSHYYGSRYYDKYYSG